MGSNSKKERVRFSGVLRGEGKGATCTGHVTKVTNPITGISAYTNYSIENVSEALPDGNYELTTNGETMRVRHKGADWVSPP